MKYVLSAVFFSLTWCVCTSAQAFSGFVQEPGSGYLKLSFATFESDRFFSTSGEQIGFGDFRQLNLSLYGEVGLLSFLTVGAAGPLTRFNSFETTDTAVGFGDLQLFAKVGGEWKGFFGSVIVAPEFPTGQSEILVDTEFEGIQNNLPSGDGEFNTWFRVAVSRSLPEFWSKASTWASIYGGYNVRTEFSDQLETGGDLGISLWQRLIVQARFQALFSPKDPEDLTPAGVFLFGEGTEYVAAGASLSGRVFETPLWLTFDYMNTFGNLRNLYAGSTFAFGLAADW